MERTLTISETEGQVKKHESQMSCEEKKYLAQKLVFSKSLLKISRHLRERIDTKDIEPNVYKMILSTKNLEDKIIEYNETHKPWGVSHRVLVRDDQAVVTDFHKAKEKEARGKAVLCFVVDIDTNTIVTAYYNYLNDNHCTIDWDRYDGNLQIII